MKSLLFCCFFMSGYLTASGSQEEIVLEAAATLPEKIIVSFEEHFKISKKGTFKGLNEGVAEKFHDNCVNSKDFLDANRIEEFFEEIGRVNFVKGYDKGHLKGHTTGYTQGFTEGEKIANERYKSLYNSPTKKSF